MNILAVGSHPDDIELGCAATLAAHSQAGHKVHMLVLTNGTASFALGADRGVRRQEQERATTIIGADLWWGTAIDCHIVDNHDTVRSVEQVVDVVRPDVVYIHSPNDTHQDHRAAAAAALSAARMVPSVLHYQSPSSRDFYASVFVDATNTIDVKIAALRCHQSQMQTGIVDEERIRANALYWGHFARTRYAEAFMPTRLLWMI